MGRGKLTKAEVEILKSNPHVEAVNEHRIIYTNEFKQHFMERYLKGERPGEIFRSAGFDLKVLGSKRIERACARWKESYASGTLGMYSAVIAEDRGMDSQQKEEAAHYDIEDIGRVKLHRGVRELRLAHQVEEQRLVIKKLQQEIRNLKATNSRLRSAAEHDSRA